MFRLVTHCRHIIATYVILGFQSIRRYGQPVRYLLHSKRPGVLPRIQQAAAYLSQEQDTQVETWRATCNLCA